MRWLTTLILCGLMMTSAARAADGRIYKVLPQFLDLKGQHALSPSLYDRDAYQAFLRKNPTNISALRFAVQWKSAVPKAEGLKVRVELRGVSADTPKEQTLEMPVEQHHWFSHWAYLTLKKADYVKLGEVTAWRVTLWNGETLLDEQKSFLW